MLLLLQLSQANKTPGAESLSVMSGDLDCIPFCAAADGLIATRPQQTAVTFLCRPTAVSTLLNTEV